MRAITGSKWAGIVTMLAFIFTLSCVWNKERGGPTMSVYTGYPAADYGPNDGDSMFWNVYDGTLGGPASPPTQYLYLGNEIEDNGDGTGDVTFRDGGWTQGGPGGTPPPQYVEIPRWVSFTASAQISKMRMVDKPEDLGTITGIKIRVLSISTGFPGGGALSFPVTVYKGDGTTVIGTDNLTVARNSRTDPLSVEGEVADGADLDFVEFTGLTISESDVGAGLVVKLDTTDAGAGWGTGTPEWDVIAVDAVLTYTSDTVFESVISLSTTLRETAFLASDASDCVLESEISTTVELTSLVDA